MTAADASRWSTAARSTLAIGADPTSESGRDDFYEHLLRVCLLLLLEEGPGEAIELRERLRPLGFELTASAVEAALDGLAAAGLVQAQGAPSSGGGEPNSFAVTADGRAWLRGATKDLRRTEAVLGGFLARCGERLLSLT